MTLTVTHTTPADGTFSATGAAAWDANHALTVSGTSGQVQFNSSGDLAGDAGLTFDATNKALTVGGGTVTASFPALSASQTWNNAAVTFTALKVDVTDTASNVSSLLFDARMGGSSQFNVRKDGAAGARTALSVGPLSGNLSFYFGPIGGGINGLVVESGARIGIAVGAQSASGPDAFFTRRGPANLRLGAADAASPIAQTLSVQSIVGGLTGTPNLSAAAYPLTITGSQGTGTGAGGSIVFQVAPAGSSGSAQNALVNALTINSARNLIVAGNGIFNADGVSGIQPNTSNIFYIDMPGGGLTARNNAGSYAQVFNFGPSGALTLGPTSAAASLVPDAANTLAQRNGVNAQTFRLYNTYSTSSDYERIGISWSSTIGYIKPENAGTGSPRLLVVSTGTAVVSTLPAAATAGAGARAFVTDATMTMTLGVGTVVAGGGANSVPVYSDGTNWLIG